MPNIYIIIITSVIFAFCTAILLYQTLYSVYFRKNIAVKHEFTEGIMTGVSFPLLWVSYGLIAVQLLSFFVFPTESELLLAARLLIFAISVIAFSVFKILTPPLFAYWFGKHAFWDTKGEIGKHSFDDIYAVKVHKKKTTTVINSQQLYRLTFYVKGKTFLLIPKKYSCKMTATQIRVLTAHVDFKESVKPKTPKKALVYSICVPILIVLITVCCFIQAVSYGILNPEAYTVKADKLDAPITKEIQVISKISDVETNGELIYVYYKNITAVNVYGTDGKYRFSISLPSSLLEHSDIAFSDGALLYKTGDKLLTYTAYGVFLSSEKYIEKEHGKLFKNDSVSIGNDRLTFDSMGVHLGSKAIISRSGIYALFDPAIIWPINMILIIALFALKFYATSKE